MQDVCCGMKYLYLWCVGSVLWHVGSLVVACENFVAAFRVFLIVAGRIFVVPCGIFLVVICGLFVVVCGIFVGDRQNLFNCGIGSLLWHEGSFHLWHMRSFSCAMQDL